MPGLLSLALVWSQGCTSTSNEAEQHTTSPATPVDFQMTFGKGGGFAGIWQRYTITAGGTVERWEGVVQPDTLQVVGRLSPAQRDSLWQKIQELDFFALPSRGAGNMTGHIAVTARDTTHEVRWPVSLEKEAMEQPVEVLYRYAQSLAQRAGSP